MAKFRPSIAGDISGKMAGVVFSRNRYGAYIRARVIPVNTRTPHQTGQRTVMAANSMAWRGLSVGDRAGWEAQAGANPWRIKAGHVITLSGQAYYVAYANLCATAAVTPSHSAGGSITVPPNTLGVAAVVSGTAINLTFSSPLGSTEYMLVEATGRRSPGVMFGAAYKQICYLGSGATSPADVHTEWQARFGTFPIEGEVLFFRLRRVILDPTGGVGVGAPETFRVVVTAT